MKLTINAADLTAAVSVASRACSARPAGPVEAAMLLQASSGDALTIRATDYQLAVRAGQPATVLEPGTVAVSGHLLAAVTRVLPRGEDGEVDLVADGALQVRAGRGSWRLPLLDVVDLYPPAPRIGQQLGAVDAATLQRGLARTLPMLSDPKVPGAQGAAQLITGDRLEIACTDTYRLAVADLDWNPTSTDTAPQELTVPGAALKLLATATPADSTEIGVYAADTVTFRWADTAVTAPLLTDYAPWRAIEPKPEDLPLRLQCDAQDLTAALSRASALLGAKEAARIGVAADALTLTAPSAERDTDATHQADVLDCHSEIPPGFTVLVNAERLQAALTAVGGPRVLLHFPANPYRAFQLLPADHQGTPQGDYRHLLMPIKLPPRGGGEAA